MLGKDKGSWLELNAAEQDAASVLGFDALAWDEGLTPPACEQPWQQLRSRPKLLAAAEALGEAVKANTALTTLQLERELCDAAGKVLGEALETNTSLTELRLSGNVSDAVGAALGAALKTNTSLTSLLFDGNLSAVAAELSVELAIQRALRQ